MKDSSELQTRRKITDLISKNPGLHLSKIANLLNFRISLVEYHLSYLEKNGVIAGIKEKGFKRYYTKGEIGVEDKKLLSLLRQEIPLRIVIFLLKNPFSQHKDILENIDVAPSTLTYHIKKLMKIGIIDIKAYDAGKGYVIDDNKRIIKLIVRYKPYSVIESFKDVWVDLQVD